MKFFEIYKQIGVQLGLLFTDNSEYQRLNSSLKYLPWGKFPNQYLYYWNWLHLILTFFEKYDIVVYPGDVHAAPALFTVHLILQHILGPRVPHAFTLLYYQGID